MEVLPDDGPGVSNDPAAAEPPARNDPQYSDADMLAVLQRIAQEAQSPTLSMAAYGQHAEPGDPAVITVIRRFGTWKKACAQAGLIPNHDSKHRESRTGRGEALAAVAKAAAAFADATGRPRSELTQDWYMQWRARHPQTRALGLSRLSKRYGTWTKVKALALRSR